MNYEHLFQKLQRASNWLRLLVKKKDEYGKTFTPYPPVPYELALKRALDDLEDVLEETGAVNLEQELRFYTSELMKTFSDN